MEEFTQLTRSTLSPGSEWGGWKAMLIPLILVILSYHFWYSSFIYPIKLLTVLFHELSHGLAAILTGGSMLKIEISANEGGLCTTAGGVRWIVLSAGYLGSLLWGSALILLAAKTDYDRQIVQVLAGILILVTVIYVRTMVGFVFGILFGIGLILYAQYFTEFACDQLLRYLGLTSSLYVLLDIKSDLIDRNIPSSDAYRLGQMIFLPGWTNQG